MNEMSPPKLGVAATETHPSREIVEEDNSSLGQKKTIKKYFSRALASEKDEKKSGFSKTVKKLENTAYNLGDPNKNTEEIKELLDSTVRGRNKSTTSSRRRQMRLRFWPEIGDNSLWIRTKRVGFTTIPRTLPIIHRILDQHAGKGFPVASTYLALWCQVFDEGFLEIRNSRELAYESGFGGPRAEVTWKARMRKLVELGVIEARPGVYGEYQYVLMLNPLQAIEKLYVDKPKDMAFQSLLSRMMQVGADDIEF